MTERMKEGEFRITIEPEALTAPRHNRDLHIFTRDYILTTNSTKSKSKYKTISHNSNNSNKKFTNRNSDLTPKPYSHRHFHLNSDISLLNSKYKNSLKNSILHSKNLDLLQKKVKILEAEEHKFESFLCRSQELERKKIKTKNENRRQKSMVQNFMRLKEKEMKEKRSKVKDLRVEEYNRIKNSIKHRKIHSDNVALKKNKMKKKILEDLSKEKDKINEENQRKINFIKKMDDDIFKRKMENEKRKKIIMMEQLEQEIKIQEQFNKKLLGKIGKYQKTGLRKIGRLLNYQ